MTTTTGQPLAQTPRTGFFARLPFRFAPAQMFGQMFGVWRQRRSLAALDKHLLDDIGVTPHAARQEAVRPFWDLPSQWTRGY